MQRKPSSDELDLCSPAGPPAAKRPRLTADYVDLTEERAFCSSAGVRIAAGPGETADGGNLVAEAVAPPRHRPDAAPTAPPRWLASPAAGLRRQQRQRSPPSGDDSEDFAIAKRLQEEEDRRTAAAVHEESNLQRRFQELEAAEAAAEAREAANAAALGWGRGRGVMSSWFGGGTGSSSHHQRVGSSSSSAAAGSAAAAAGAAAAGRAAATAAAAAAGGLGGLAAPGPPRATSRGPRSARSRRGPAAEAEFANAMSGALMGPPFMHGGTNAGRGGRFGYFGQLQALQQAMQQQAMLGLNRGLPADMLFSGRDFTDADYERLLALDEGLPKRGTAPRDRVNQLETVRVPLIGGMRSGSRGGGGAAAAAAAAAAGSDESGGSPPLELDSCAICLEDACPGDKFRVLGCRHSFHQKCIDRWLTQERNSCPICQRQVV